MYLSQIIAIAPGYYWFREPSPESGRITKGIIEIQPVILGGAVDKQYPIRDCEVLVMGNDVTTPMKEFQKQHPDMELFEVPRPF